MYDIIIIGGGPAGLSAAIYARRAGVSVLVLEQTMYGGQMMNTPEVENYPGVPLMGGADLAVEFYRQAADLGAEILLEGVESLDLTGEVKRVRTAGGEHEGKTVILANGAKRRKLGCPGKELFAGRGVSYCATCDGAFFKGKEVAIVGGGNTALEDALFLSNHCTAVHLIHRRDQFRGGKILADAVLARANIQVHYDAAVEEIHGSAKVEAVTLRNLKTDERTRLPVAGVFVAVGLEPENGFVAGQVDLDKAGYILAGEDCKTNLPGVYAAGDTRTKTVRQIITAAADGAVAAIEASNRVNAG
mgnify:FL=1